jgi:7-carboxy-7-deazaguanine synthase
MATAERVRTFPVVEVFGPVVQGEGALAGLPTHFIRFGGCDYRCSWCDSMFAVDPALVRAHADKLTLPQLLGRLEQLPRGPSWVTFSGGNPALHQLAPLVDALQAHRWRIAVETQASMWRPWLADVDHLVCSPKPPSSGEASLTNIEQTATVLQQAHAFLLPHRRSLKIVVFDQADLDWAAELIAREAEYEWDCYLSVGTDPAPSGLELVDVHLDEVRAQVCDRYRWLCAATVADPRLWNVRVLPQLHVLAYGHQRGV